MNPAWLEWTQRLQAIAQTGLTYAADPYDIERYEQIRALAAEIAAGHSDAGIACLIGWIMLRLHLNRRNQIWFA